MPSRFVSLAAAASEDAGVPVEQVLLLRHSSKNIRALLRAGASVEEYTALQPTGSKYDFLDEGYGPARVVVVVVHDIVYDVYALAGVESEGTTYSMASPALHQFDLERGRQDRLARRFRLVSLPSRVVGQPVRGWEGRVRTPVQRAGDGFFREIEVELSGRDEGAPADRVLEDLQRIRDDSSTPATSRAILAQARLGQGRFRRDLLAIWEGRCAVTGCDVAEALRASHCKPWRDADNAERLDPANGLILVATLDAFFDAGLLTFTDEGQMLLAGSLTRERQSRLGVPTGPLRAPLSARQRAFLQYHRDNVFHGVES